MAAKERANHTKEEVLSVLRLPSLWQIAVVFFCTYSLSIGISFFTPYLSFSFGLSDRVSGWLTIIPNFVFLAATPLMGLAADRLFRSTLRLFVYVAPLLAAGFLAIGGLGVMGGGSAPLVIGITMVTAFLTCGLYASMFSIIAECRYSVAMMGMVTGFVSMASSTPDIVLQPLFGRFVDEAHYTLVMLVLAVFSLLAGFFAQRLRRRIVNGQEENVFRPSP